MLAAKFLDDHYYNNAYYAKIGGISTQEMNRLEVDMLTLLDHRLYFSAEAVRSFLVQLQSGNLLLLECLSDSSKAQLAKKRKSFSLLDGGEEKRRHSDAAAACPVAAAAEGIACGAN